MSVSLERVAQAMEADEIVTAEIDVQAYWRLIRRSLWAIVLAVVVAGTATYAVSAWIIPPVYQATVRLVVQPRSSLNAADYNDILAGQRAAATYAEMLQSLPLQEEALRRLGYSEAQLLQFAIDEYPYELTAQPLRDTQIVELSVESTDRKLATELANTLVDIFIQENEERQTSRFTETQSSLRDQIAALEADLALQNDRLAALTDPADQSQTELQISRLQDSLSQLGLTLQDIQLAELQAVDLLTIVEPARLPQLPIRPRKVLNTAIAAVLGAVLAIGWAFLRDMVDTHVRDAEEIAALTQSPIIGQIWYEPEVVGTNGEGRLAMIEKPLSLTAEAFRLLRANLQFVAVDRALHTLLISSPGPTEGKSTVALNLGVAIASAGQKVIIIDADMRRPRVAAYAGVEDSPGLSDALVSHTPDIKAFLQSVPGVEQVWVLPPGATPPNPAELLGSQRMAEILDACSQIADYTIVDSPPLLMTADSVLLAARTDGVLLVVEPGHSDRRALSQVVEQLQRSAVCLLGTVLNKMPTSSGTGYPYYSYYRSYTAGSEETVRHSHSVGARLASWLRRVR